MNQTDKNVAMAKECGARINTDGVAYHLLDGSIAFVKSSELDEYTSRVCAGSQELQAKLDAAIDALAERDDKELRQDNVITLLNALIAEKDALISTQAEALRYAIDDLVIRAKLNGDDDSLSIGQGCLDQMNEALSASTETVAAWKNRQGDKK